MVFCCFLEKLIKDRVKKVCSWFSFIHEFEIVVSLYMLQFIDRLQSYHCAIDILVLKCRFVKLAILCLIMLFPNRRTADVRSCGYIELFVLSKDDVMSSIRDYPDAQRILAKHGRKRLALGSKVATGPRDETTSGSNSDSEIELKITRPDSDGSSHSVFTENRVIENNNSVCITREVSHTTVDIKDSVFKETSIEEFSPSKFLVSPRNSVFLDTPNCKSVSMVQLKRASIGSQCNVIGPATSLKSLDKRSLEKSLSQSLSRKTSTRRSKSAATPVDSSSDEEDRNTDHDNDNTRLPNNKRWLKPRNNSKNHMRRSNSDMQRRPRRRSQQHSQRYVFSDGESKGYHRWNNNNNNNNNNKRTLSPSTISQSSNATINSSSKNRHHNHHRHHHNHNLVMRNEECEATMTTPDEDIFLRSMKKLYLETTTHFKKRTVR